MICAASQGRSFEVVALEINAGDGDLLPRPLTAAAEDLATKIQALPIGKLNQYKTEAAKQLQQSFIRVSCAITFDLILFFKCLHNFIMSCNKL